ncbi:hypothetical protein GF343_04380 [Candidatus Woesearchaeota archaeon]|nr:hypothetical protein [Candidatus Woesearchaeota archaeon]
MFGNEKSQEKIDALITESIEEKAKIYDDMDEILSPEDKDFIMNDRLKKIISHFPDVDHPFEWMQHLYAYKLMKSMGIKDKAFRDKFTRLFGWNLMQAEMCMPRFARFLSDEYTKNRGIDIKHDNGLTLAFDFSPKFGLVQEDDFFTICNLGKT